MSKVAHRRRSFFVSQREVWLNRAEPSAFGSHQVHIVLPPFCNSLTRGSSLLQFYFVASNNCQTSWNIPWPVRIPFPSRSFSILPLSPALERYSGWARQRKLCEEDSFQFSVFFRRWTSLSPTVLLDGHLRRGCARLFSGTHCMFRQNRSVLGPSLTTSAHAKGDRDTFYNDWHSNTQLQKVSGPRSATPRTNEYRHL